MKIRKKIKNQKRIKDVEIFRCLQKIKKESIHSPSPIFIYTIPLTKKSTTLKERKILEILKSWGTIKIFKLAGPTFIIVKRKKKVIKRKQVMFVPIRILQPKFEEVDRYYREKIKIPIVGEKQKEKRRNLITRDKISGDFYYKNELIQFKNKDAIYYLIFECLYEKRDLNGFCSYEIIDKYLVKHGKGEYDDYRQKIDRIKNGIINLFRFSDLPQKTPDGKEIIQKVRGKGIILYNPPL